MHSNNIPYFPFYPYCHPYYHGQNMVFFPKQNEFLQKISPIPTSHQSQSKASTSENSQNNREKQKKKTKLTKISQKEDDQSFIVKSKRKKHSHISQKQNRNVVSNILRSFLKYLSTKQAKQVSDRISQKVLIETSLEDIQMWLEEYGVNYRNYVRLETIFKMIRKEKGEKSRLFLMLYSNYTKNQLRTHFLTSLKLKQENRSQTLLSIREIENQLREVYIEHMPI